MIRSYEPRDLNDCRQLWVTLTEWHREIYEAPGIGGSDPGAQFDEHLEAVGAGNLWVAEREDSIVGLVGMIPGDGQAEVEPVVVAASERRGGIGRALLERVIEEARVRGLPRLTVRPVGRNAPALAFFKEHGFSTVGHVELMADFDDRQRNWRPGAEISGTAFEV